MKPPYGVAVGTGRVAAEGWGQIWRVNGTQVLLHVSSGRPSPLTVSWPSTSLGPVAAHIHLFLFPRLPCWCLWMQWSPLCFRGGKIQKSTRMGPLILIMLSSGSQLAHQIVISCFLYSFLQSLFFYTGSCGSTAKQETSQGNNRRCGEKLSANPTDYFPQRQTRVWFFFSYPPRRDVNKKRAQSLSSREWHVLQRARKHLRLLKKSTQSWY